MAIIHHQQRNLIIPENLMRKFHHDHTHTIFWPYQEKDSRWFIMILQLNSTQRIQIAPINDQSLNENHQINATTITVEDFFAFALNTTDSGRKKRMSNYNWAAVGAMWVSWSRRGWQGRKEGRKEWWIRLLTRMVTRWPEATAMRLSWDHLMELGKVGVPTTAVAWAGAP